MTEQAHIRHVLFVDDDAASRRIVERILRVGVPNVRVTCAGDGARALEVLAREQVDLLITDLAMPVMDGVELLRQVTNLRIPVPVVVVTGHGSPADETRAFAGGAVEYFNKPIEAESFVRGVQDLLEAAVHRSHIEGVSIAGFVQLLNMERKTCALRASVPGAQGVLFFNSGALVDARQAELCGADAALEIFTWKEPVIQLEAQSRKRPATIHVGVTELLLESARLADERERNLRRSINQGRTSTRAEIAPAPPSPRGPALSLVPPPRPTPAPAPVAAAAAAPAPETAPTAGASSAPVAWEGPEAQAEFAALVAEAMKIEGATAAAVAHWELDHSLAALALQPSPEATVSGNCRVMRALMSGLTRLGLRSRVQDILITLDEQSHILWPLPRHDGLFLYLALDRVRGNPALTRHRLQKLVEARAL